MLPACEKHGAYAQGVCPQCKAEAREAATKCTCDPHIETCPVCAPALHSALATQVAGNHYKDLKIQPIEYIHANGIPFAEGSVIKYVTRWRAKGGVDDLKKARHFLDLLIELETREVVR